MLVLLCALICGFGFALALPPFDQGWLCWLALAPMLWAACRGRLLEAAGVGMIAGLTCAVFQVRWHHDTDRLFWAYLPFLWVSLLFLIVCAVACVLRPRTGSGQWVIGVACTGVALEWVTTWLPMPVHVALTQYRYVLVIQIASLTGIWGVSLLIWLVNAAIADAILRRRPVTVPLGLAVTLTAISVLFGTSHVSRHPADESRPTRVQVAAIQDFTGDETEGLAPQPKVSADRDQQTIAATSGPNPARLVVWSEECLGYGFDPTGLRDPTRKLARARDTVLVAGFNDDHLPKPHNCAGVVDADGRTARVFQKTHLYLSERFTNTPGVVLPAVATRIGRVGAMVCYDSCYTGVTRRLAATGAQIIAMPNYDPPTPRGVLHTLHSAFLPFRAVENAVPFVRSDSNGLSQIVDSSGRIVAEGPLYQAAIITAAIVPGDGKGTFFTRTGDWLAWLSIGVSVYVMVLAGVKPTPNRTQRAPGVPSASGG